MTSRAESLVEAVDRLVTLPAVYFEIKRVIDSPDSDIIDAAKAISTDAALTSRLLRIVNSPVYAQGRPVETVTRAVSLMGMNQVHDLCLAASLATAFAGIKPESMDVARFWRNSQLCASTARKLAETCCIMERERLFVIGLLADIGHMVFYLQVPDLMARVMLEQEQTGAPIHEIERRLIGCDYAEAGGALLRRWGLPEALCQVVEQHVDPQPETPYALKSALLHLIIGALEAHRSGRAILDLTLPEAWHLAEMSPESVMHAMTTCAAELRDTPSAFES